MSTASTEGHDPISQAVTALTAAAGEGRDFGEVACHVMTTVAANVGGIEELLARRPGSWEAAHVREMIASTAGTDHADLMRWRTKPVRLALDVDELFSSLDLDRLYEDDLDVSGEDEDAADEALFDAVATADERDRAAAIGASMPPLLSGDLDYEHMQTLMNEASAINDQVADRGRVAGHPQYAARETARRRRAAVAELWERDRDEYVEAYTATVRRLLAERGIAVEAEVARIDGTTTAAASEYDALAAELDETARRITPLPMTGDAPDWAPGATVATLRTTGLTYLDRIASQ